jgi:hypothetical protein
MCIFNSNLVLRMKIIEEQQFHDIYNTLLYSWKQLCNITKMYPSNNICFYTQKSYISFELTCFGVQNLIIIKDLLIYIINVQFYNHNNKGQYSYC